LSALLLLLLLEDWEGELAGTQSDVESKWITMEYNAPSPYLGYKLTTHNKPHNTQNYLRNF